MHPLIAAGCGAFLAVLSFFAPAAANAAKNGHSSNDGLVGFLPPLAPPLPPSAQTEPSEPQILMLFQDQPELNLRQRCEHNIEVMRRMTAESDFPEAIFKENCFWHTPALGYLSSSFGVRQSPFSGRARFHKGIDIAAHENSPIYAVADGVVSFAGWNGPLGRVVTIEHSPGIETHYAHAASLDVARGMRVKRGDRLGKVGNSGRSTGTHLHFEVQIGGKLVDPRQFVFDPPSEFERYLANTDNYDGKSNLQEQDSSFSRSESIAKESSHIGTDPALLHFGIGGEAEYDENSFDYASYGEYSGDEGSFRERGFSAPPRPRLFLENVSILAGFFLCSILLTYASRLRLLKRSIQIK